MKAASCIIATAIIFVVGCTQQRETSQSAPKNESFFVHLQGGFSGKNVQVFVDGCSLYDGRPTTNPLDGLAEEFTGSARSTSITVTVAIPGENLKSTHHIDLTKARGIGISIVGGKVKIRQANAFGYD